MRRRQFLNKSLLATGGVWSARKGLGVPMPAPAEGGITGLDSALAAADEPGTGPVYDWHHQKDNAPDTADPDYQHAPTESVEAWKDKKFGIRIHWGVYCLIGSNASWSLPNSSREYQDLYGTLYEFFDPTEFDADQWMDLFDRAGAKFFTFTSKHHDGFCMWPTRTTQKAIRRTHNGISFRPRQPPNFEGCTINYSIVDTPYRKDIVGAIVQAARRKGLGIGLYYSHVDWHDPAFAWDPYNIHFDAGYNKQSDPERWQSFIDREREQVRELVTSYGPLDILCFDACWPKAAREDAARLAKMVRKLQPNILMRDRGVGAYGDFYTPEGNIPEGFSEGNWMVIYPCGHSPAYLPFDTYKPKEWVLESLIDITAKGGNFEVCFGPMPNGKWPQDAVARLEYVGQWLGVNGEAIYKTRPWSAFKQGDDIRFTRSKDGKFIYAISLQWPGREFAVRSVRAKPGSVVHMLGVKQPLRWKQANELVIEVPSQVAENKPCQQAYSFKIEVEP